MQQRAMVRAQVGSPGWWLLVAGAGLGAGTAAWAYTGDMTGGFVCGLVALTAVVGLTWWGAGRSARLATYQAWAYARGLESTNALQAPLTTPLLQRGEIRQLERAYLGVVQGLEYVVGHFTWISVRRTYSQDGTYSESRTPHPFTVLQVVTGLSGVLRFSLLPRTAGDRLIDAAGALLGPDRMVQLESAQLEDSFRLTVADEESEIAVRRLFTPSLIVDILNPCPQMHLSSLSRARSSSLCPPTATTPACSTRSSPSPNRVRSTLSRSIEPASRLSSIERAEARPLHRSRRTLMGMRPPDDLRLRRPAIERLGQLLGQLRHRCVVGDQDARADQDQERERHVFHCRLTALHRVKLRRRPETAWQRHVPDV
ncbi:MAG: hypothetical protein QOJ13_980 [Gaiellales bacterium]|nr:hypothetical protein [Gaiellales bacterium]